MLWLRSPPFLPASDARTGSFLKLPPLARPPLLAISRCFSRSIAAKPRREGWPLRSGISSSFAGGLGWIGMQTYQAEMGAACVAAHESS